MRRAPRSGSLAIGTMRAQIIVVDIAFELTWGKDGALELIGSHKLVFP